MEDQTDSLPCTLIFALHKPVGDGTSCYFSAAREKVHLFDFTEEEAEHIFDQIQSIITDLPLLREYIRED